MYSTGLEVAGLICFVIAAAVLGGSAAALITGGVSCLFVGASVDDSALGENVRTVAAIPIKAALGVRNAWRRQLVGQRLLDALHGEQE